MPFSVFFFPANADIAKKKKKMNTHSVNDSLFFTPSLAGKIFGSNCLLDGCTSCDVRHWINSISCCYQWHMRGLFFPYHCDVVQHHTCSDDSTRMLRIKCWAQAYPLSPASSPSKRPNEEKNKYFVILNN